MYSEWQRKSSSRIMWLCSLVQWLAPALIKDEPCSWMLMFGRMGPPLPHHGGLSHTPPSLHHVGLGWVALALLLLILLGCILLLLIVVVQCMGHCSCHRRGGVVATACHHPCWGSGSLSTFLIYPPYLLSSVYVLLLLFVISPPESSPAAVGFDSLSLVSFHCSWSRFILIRFESPRLGGKEDGSWKRTTTNVMVLRTDNFSFSFSTSLWTIGPFSRLSHCTAQLCSALLPFHLSLPLSMAIRVVGTA